MKPLRWPVGGLWEDDEITIEFDVPVSRLVGGSIYARLGRDFGAPCPHAMSVSREPAKDGGRDCEQESWTVPRVVVAHNEAGHASTGVCCDCLADALASHQSDPGPHSQKASRGHQPKER